MTRICNVAALFVQRHVKYIYSAMWVETWFETELKDDIYELASF